MFKVEKLERLVELILLTAYIKNDNAVSMMLVAIPESYKTSILRSIISAHSLEVMDLSPVKIKQEILPLIKDKKVFHLVIPDLVKLLSHKPHTVDATITFLNALMEEGVKRSMFYGQSFEMPYPVKCGIITSVTPEYFKRMFKRWNDIGFISRFLQVSYKYSDETIAEIHELIEKSDTLSISSTKLKKRRQYSISIPKDISGFISLKAQEIAKKESSAKVPVPAQGRYMQWIKPKVLGFRLQRQLKQIVRAIALSDSNIKPKVTWNHANELNILLDYIRTFQNPKII